MHLDLRVAMLGTAGVWSPRSLSYGVSIFFLPIAGKKIADHIMRHACILISEPDLPTLVTH
jgi:hypothetical protein